MIESEFNMKICEASIFNYIKGFNYSFKRAVIQPEIRNSDETITKIKLYADRFQIMGMFYQRSKVYFLDEVGFSVSMRTAYGRFLVGNTPVTVIRSIRTRNISICAVDSKDSLENYEHRVSAYNSSSFIEFLEGFFNILSQRNEVAPILIMDNVAFHKIIGVRQKMDEMGCIYAYLPPYSTFLNPIENVFSKVKQYVKMEKPTMKMHL